MPRHHRVEIEGSLPAGVRDELDRRFGAIELRDVPGRTVLGLRLDQAGLRALLGLLWDAGLSVAAVVTTEGGTDVRH